MARTKIRHRVLSDQPEDEHDQGHVDGEEAQEDEQPTFAERFGVAGEE